MILRIWQFINELQLNGGVVAGVSCLIFIVSFLLKKMFRR